MSVRELGNAMGNPLAFPKSAPGGSSGVGDIVTRLSPPSGSYVEADGRQLLKDMYPKLFSVIGDAYSVADFSGGLTTVTLPSSQGWVAMAYGAGVFVALASATAIAAVSADGGTTWSSLSLPVSASWISLIYAGGLFVAIARASSIAITSPDGISWTQRALPSSDQWCSLAFGNGIYMAFADAGAMAKSIDGGQTWQTGTSLPASGARYSAFGVGLFVVLTSGAGSAYTSPDGVTWTSRVLTGATSTTWIGIAYGNGLFIALNSVNNVGEVSSDGVIWSPTVPPFLSGPGYISFGQGRFFVTLVSGSSPLWTSTLGASWTTTTLGTAAHSVSAIGGGSAVFLRSTLNPSAERYSVVSTTNFNVPSLKGDGRLTAYIKVA